MSGTPREPEAGGPGKVRFPGAALLNPVPVVLVASREPGEGGRANVFTVAWTGMVCSKPPMLSIAIRPERLSHGIISRAGCFTVNLPPVGLARETDLCGVRSGRDLDKIAACGFALAPAAEVAAPLLSACPVNLECRVAQVIRLGSHDLFLARILASHVDARLVDAKGEIRLDRADLLAYCHGDYVPLGRGVGRFGFSTRPDGPARKGKPQARKGRGGKK